MKLREMLDQLKAGSEFVVKGAGVVTCNVQAAAFGRTLGAERCNDDVASGLDGMRYLDSVRKWNTARSCQTSYRCRVKANVVTSPQSQLTVSAPSPSRSLATSN